MEINIFSRKKLIWLATGLVVVLAAMIFGPGKKISAIDPGIQPHLGEWEVTNLTGFVNYKVKGGSSYCESQNENYYPIIDKDQTFIRFYSSHSDPKLENIPREVYDTLNVMEDVEGLFIFQFSFDHGYDTNAALESFHVPYHHTKVLKGSMWTFEVGLWTEVEAFEEKGPYVLGEIISGSKWGGRRHVKVMGQFKGKDRIEGQWTWDEVTAGPISVPECESRSEGQGTWVAIRK